MKNAPEMKIDEPCSKRWAQLDGAGMRRYCGECALHVVNGSALTKPEAEALVEGSAGRICMRLELDEQGSAVHAPELSKASKPSRAGIGLTLAAGMLVACTDRPPESSTPTEPALPQASIPASDKPLERPLEIMGEVCYPQEITPPQEEPLIWESGNVGEALPHVEIMGRI